MNKDRFDILVNKMNNGLLDAVKNFMYKEFGSDFGLEMKVIKGLNDNIVFLKETNGDSTTMCTSSPILKQLFAETSLQLQCWYSIDTNQAGFYVSLQYQHNYRAGSNGHALMSFTMDADTYKVIEIDK